MTKEIRIMAFVLNQTGIIIVRDMSSTDRRQQYRTMLRVMAERIKVIRTVTVTASRPDENKEKQGPSGMVILSERHADCYCSHNKNM